MQDNEILAPKIIEGAQDISEPQPGTALVKINPELDTVFIGYQAQAVDILRFAESRVVGSDAEMKSATEDLSIIARLKKGIEEKRKEYVGPLIAHEKAINAQFKTISEPIDRADRITRDNIQIYRAEVAMRIAEAEAINREKEELARREAALNEGVITVDTNPVVVPQAAPDKVRTELGSLGTATVRKWELIDIKLVPEDLKVLDVVKINKLVRAGIPSIPGIRIFEEEQLRVTTR